MSPDVEALAHRCMALTEVIADLTAQREALREQMVELTMDSLFDEVGA